MGDMTLIHTEKEIENLNLNSHLDKRMDPTLTSKG